MSNSDKQGIKSSYELAMERLNVEMGAVRHVTDEQRQELADIDEKARAKLAEMDIHYDKERAAARERGDAAGLQKLEQERELRRQKISQDAEERKEQVRRRGV